MSEHGFERRSRMHVPMLKCIRVGYTDTCEHSIEILHIRYIPLVKRTDVSQLGFPISVEIRVVRTRMGH